MFTHQDIWTGIDRLASSHGYSTSGLAIKAGLDPTSFNKSKRISPDGKLRWPSTESLSKVLAATGATVSDLAELIDADIDEMPKTGIPVIGFAQAGDSGYFDEEGYPKGDAWDVVELPMMNVNAADTVFALKVSGNSMEPLYRKNDILIVDPADKIRKHDRIIVKTSDGEVMAKELKKKTAEWLTLTSLNGDYEDRTFHLNDIAWMAKIAWVSQ